MREHVEIGDRFRHSIDKGKAARVKICNASDGTPIFLTTKRRDYLAKWHFAFTGNDCVNRRAIS